jgi:hypothetical protein
MDQDENTTTDTSPQLAGAAAAGCSCRHSGGGKAPRWVYALGRIEVRFPSVGIEKEFIQALGRAETAGLTDRQALCAMLSERKNRYLARKVCFLFTIEGMDTYILRPREPSDLDLLVESIRPAPRTTDVDVVIGMRGPIAAPSVCNGIQVPIVTVDQVYSFDVDALIKSIPRPDKLPEDQFGAAAEELFLRLIQMADNSGSSDEDRALNYLALRYPAIYSMAAHEFAHSCALTRVEVRPSRLSGTRKVLDVIFSFTNRNTDVISKQFVRVDVSEQFPFLTTKLSPYYDR